MLWVGLLIVVMPYTDMQHALTSRDVELFVTSNYIDAAMRAELEKLIELK